MFTTARQPSSTDIHRPLFATPTVAELEGRLVAIESQISTLRAEQVVLVNELDRAQAPMVDASRSLNEWVQSHLDVGADLAQSLVFAARAIGHHRSISHRLASGACTFDRAVATTRYATTGASGIDVEESYTLDLDGVRRLTARRHRVTRHDEREEFASRYFTSQVSLDHSRYRFWGQLPGVAGRTLEKAMFERADELREASPDVPSTRSQRQADAMVAMAQDSLDRQDGATEPRLSATAAHVTVFVDARADDPAESTAEVAYGTRVGPDTLEAILCTGRVRVVGMADGKPVTTSNATRAIPSAIRDAVIRRDGACTIDGCRSRYRLEPHHIEHWSRGGTHDMSNLATLCWYHHHVAIHGAGYRIDPATRGTRRRLTRLPLGGGSDPP